jgi:hypothetical protein
MRIAKTRHPAALNSPAPVQRQQGGGSGRRSTPAGYIPKPFGMGHNQPGATHRNDKHRYDPRTIPHPISVTTSRPTKNKQALITPDEI